MPELSQNNPLDRGVYASAGLALSIVKSSTVADGDSDLFILGAPAYSKGYFPDYSDFAVRDARHWVWVTLQVHSRNNAGTVPLKSADSRDTPQINFNSFSAGNSAGGADQVDLQASAEGIALARKMYADLIPLGGSFTEVWPGPNVSSTEVVKDFTGTRPGVIMGLARVLSVPTMIPMPFSTPNFACGV